MVDPRIKRKRRQRLTITILVGLVMLLAGGGVAAWAYVRNIEAKINPVWNADPTAQKVLDPPKAPGEPFYMLLMGDDRRPGEKRARSDTLILARVDPKAKKIQLISIPRDSRVKIPGYSAPQKINAAAAWGGPELTIKTVKALTGLPISHFLTVDFDGLRGVVDALGGVWVDVPVKIDDNKPPTNWGRKTKVIQKGYQKLDGWHALTFVRTRHQFADGDFSRIKNQQIFLKALVKQGLSLNGFFNAGSIINTVSNNIHTDFKLGELADLVTQFRGMKEGDLEAVTIPSTTDFIDGTSFVVIKDAEFDKMIARMKKGEPLDPKAQAAGGSKTTTSTPTGSPAPAMPPSEITLTVKNGAGVSGLAKTAAKVFTDAGYPVKETGNMSQFVYGKTLIVYKTGTDKQAAIVRDTLGYGDVVAAAGLYKFNTDILVVVGKDWKSPTGTSHR